MKSSGAALMLLATAACASVPSADRSPSIDVALPGGANWSAVVPENWNGTLLLHSRGYAPAAGLAEPAPQQYRDAFLTKGYALAASNYGSGGWALAEAVPAQEATLAAFARRYGKPKTVIAYGFSMGGLVTTALAEKQAPAIDGAIAFCGSIGGTIGMMNMGLDGAFAFKQLLAPQSDLKLVGIVDDRANAAVAQAITGEAMATPAGRARLALAATLAGIPAWVDYIPGESPAARRKRETEALLKAFPMGVFLPRAEQEQRAGVGYSWNEGVDYLALLDRSGRSDFIRAVYRDAGLDLEDDLARLEQGPRIRPEQTAVAYMTDNYVPTGMPSVPMLAVQALGDFITSPSLQERYSQMAPERMFRSVYLPQFGHCTFGVNQVLESLSAIEQRLDTGSWGQDFTGSTTERPKPTPRH